MERWHEDGMEISYDSPEAFEEVIWLSYMKNKIVIGDRLSTLTTGDQTPEFAEIIRSEVKKLLLLDAGAEKSPPLRYLSKNNANISRIGVINSLFPSSAIVVPFRQPLAHVSSLIKQHEKFTGYHQEDKFSKRYMEWLGHYDFGENFKPINFDNWLDDKDVVSQSNENFWMKYWIATYAHVLKHKTENVYFVNFDKLLKEGKSSLNAIAECLGLANKTKLVEAATKLRSPTSKKLEPHHFSPKILHVAQELHKKLKSMAV